MIIIEGTLRGKQECYSNLLFVFRAASKVRRAGPVAGKLLIKSKVSAYKLIVPFSVNLYHGHLYYQHSVTRFFTGPPHLGN